MIEQKLLAAVGLWLATGITFYLYDFSIIGVSLSLGMGCLSWLFGRPVLFWQFFDKQTLLV